MQQGGDSGRPVTISQPDSVTAAVFKNLASGLMAALDLDPMPTYQGTRATRLGAKARASGANGFVLIRSRGIPVFLTLLAGVLIASTQRQSPLADWENHWITAVVAIGAAVGLSALRPSICSNCCCPSTSPRW